MTHFLSASSAFFSQPDSLAFDTQVSLIQHQVLALLYKLCDWDTGRIQISQHTIAKYLSKSANTTISPVIHALVKLGYVKIVFQDGFNGVNVYQLCAPRFEDGVITRPDGSTFTTGFAAGKAHSASRKQSNSDYRSAQAKAAKSLEADTQYDFIRTIEFRHEGKSYTYADLIADSKSGNEPVFPSRWYTAYGVEWPSKFSASAVCLSFDDFDDMPDELFSSDLYEVHLTESQSNELYS